MKSRRLIAAGTTLLGFVAVIAATITTANAATPPGTHYSFSSKSPDLTPVTKETDLSWRNNVGHGDLTSVRLMNKVPGQKAIGFSFSLPSQQAGSNLQMTCFAKAISGSNNHIHARLIEKADDKLIGLTDVFSDTLTGQWASTTSSLTTKQSDSTLIATIYSNNLHSTDANGSGKIYVDDCTLTTGAGSTTTGRGVSDPSNNSDRTVVSPATT